MLKDLFGGDIDKCGFDQSTHHSWVGVGGPVEHCMTCRLGPDQRQIKCMGPPICKICGHHLDWHQAGRNDHEFERI
jgi:hypothetical protein